MLPFLAAYLLVNEGIPPWVVDLRRHLQPMLVAKAKPLTKTRIEKVFRSLGYEPFHGFVAPLEGAKGSYVTSASSGDMESCALLVRPSGRVSLIAFERDAVRVGSTWPCLVDAAQIKGNTLLLGGLIGWFGNGARYALETYRRNGQKWIRTSRAETKHECWGADIPASLLAGGTVQMESRTYGKSVECCHATALVSIGETFRVRRGLVKRVEEKRLDTAFNAFDNLAGVLASGNTHALRRMVPSKSLRRRLAKIWPLYGPGPRVEVVDNGGRVDGETYGWSRDGSSETVWLSFARRSGSWVVTKIS